MPLTKEQEEKLRVLQDELNVFADNYGAQRFKDSPESFVRHFMDMFTTFHKEALEAQRKEIVEGIEEKRVHGDNSRNWQYVDACEDILSLPQLTGKQEEDGN